MAKISKRNAFRIIWLFLVSLFFLWQWSSYQSSGVDPRLLKTDSKVKVMEDASRISFMYDRSSNVEVIFFPGGLVEPKAYVPFCRKIAEAGYNVHIIKMPWRMSTKGYNRIKEIFHLENEEKVFVLGGHSQGAKMAAQFVYENEGLISGLFLLGTSHPRDVDMSGMEIPCIKIYAGNDGLASVEEVFQNRDKLPENCILKMLDGANHSQFGYFGKLLMDGTASISREEQHEETARILLGFLSGFKANNASAPSR